MRYRNIFLLASLCLAVASSAYAEDIIDITGFTPADVIVSTSFTCEDKSVRGVVTFSSNVDRDATALSFKVTGITVGGEALSTAILQDANSTVGGRMITRVLPSCHGKSVQFFIETFEFENRKIGGFQITVETDGRITGLEG